MSAHETLEEFIKASREEYPLEGQVGIAERFVYGGPNPNTNGAAWLVAGLLQKIYDLQESLWDDLVLAEVTKQRDEAIKERDAAQNQCADHMRGENDALNELDRWQSQIAQIEQEMRAWFKQRPTAAVDRWADQIKALREGQHP